MDKYAIKPLLQFNFNRLFFLHMYKHQSPKESYSMKDLAGNNVQLPPELHIELSEWFSSGFKALSITKIKMIKPGHDPTLVNKTLP